MSEVHRETRADGSLTLSSEHCRFVYSRPRSGSLLVTISGDDHGQFGTATLDEIRLELLRQRPLELFVDASEATGAAVSVSRDWTQFFALNREHLKRVSVLVGSQLMQLTIAIAQELSRTGNLIQITSDPDTFASRLAGRP
ncbi:MAG: hypothetical protein ABI411_13060 [Tahibacter sp.]